MGIKILSTLNMISWSCLHLFKNQITCIQLQSSSSSSSPSSPIANKTIKVIDSEGFVKIYHRPINVSELMLKFPKHLVCRADSFYIGQKIPPLSENDQLQLGHKYFLLPKHFFQSVLTFVTIASFFTPSSRNINHNPKHRRLTTTTSSCEKPFDIQKTPSGCLRIRVSDEFISRLLEQSGSSNKVITGRSENDAGFESAAGISKVCSTPQLVKDYSQLVRRLMWKPQLDTIRESSHRRRLSSFGIGKKKRKPSKSKPPPPPIVSSAKPAKISRKKSRT